MSEAGEGGGVREQKRRETLRRIADAGVKLFSTKGYEATTIDMIAAEAGISRRNFFHYFKSKDEILLSLQGGMGERIVAAINEQPTSLSPLEAARAAMLSLVAPYSPEELLALDRLMRSSEGVQARKQAGYARDERLVLEALRQRWPTEPDASLRLVALLTIGIQRQSLDAWSTEAGVRPLGDYLREAFDALAVVRG